MAKATKVNLRVLQGSDFAHEYNYVDANGNVIDLTNYTARSQFRELVTDVAFFYEATTGNGKITIDGATGKITLKVPASDSSSWTAIYNAVYDLEIVAPDTTVTRIVEGKVTIDPEVTR